MVDEKKGVSRGLAGSYSARNKKIGRCSARMVSMQRLRDLPLTSDIMADGWDFWMSKIEQGERGAPRAKTRVRR